MFATRRGSHAPSPRTLPASAAPSVTGSATAAAPSSPAPQSSPARTAPPVPASPVRTVSPSPRASASVGAPPAPSPAGTGLVAGPYGFAYPAGWVLSPLSRPSPAVQTATVTDPSGGGRLDYLADTSLAVYNPDHTVNDVHIEVAIRTALPCSQLVSATQVPNRGFGYTCSPVPASSREPAMNVTGMALVLPYPQGVKILQVTLPGAEDAVAASILAGFH